MSVTFNLSCKVPSKANFRRGGKDWRRRWQRIKQFEHDLGMAAMVAGAKLTDSDVEVKIVLYDQVIDTDNAAKSILDALEGVVVHNDRQVAGVAIARRQKSRSLPYVEVTVKEAVQ